MYASNILFYSSGIIDNTEPTTCPKDAIPNHAVLAVGYSIDLANPSNSYV